MASDFDKPINTTAYTDVWAFVRDNITDVATWFDSITGSSIPTNAKRFNDTNRRFEYWDGAAWLELLAKATTAYDIRAAVADLADLATTATTAGACTGNAATATLATNSLQLGGVVASSYTLNTDIRSVTYGGTGSNTVAGARTNLSVYSKSEGDARYLLESNNLSDLTSASTARSNLSVYSKSEIDNPTFVSTNPSIPVGSSAVAAPSGYVFAWMGEREGSISGSVLLTAINSAGTSVTVNNTFSVTITTVRFVWKKFS